MRRDAALGTEALADVLLDLASHNQAVENRVARMTSSGEENLERFRRGLKNIVEEDHFYTWEDRHLFAQKLTELLTDLNAADPDPRQGVEAVFQLYRMDEELFARWDESGEDVSMFFTLEAPEVFSRFWSKCDETTWQIDGLIELTKKDDYGDRAYLFKYAADGLSELGTKKLVDRLWTLAHQQDEEAGDPYWLNAIEAVAQRTGDALLFEEARRAARGELSQSDLVAIAKNYHDAGDSKKALEILNTPLKDSPDAGSERRMEMIRVLAEDAGWEMDLGHGMQRGMQGSLDWERDRLLVDIHRSLGNREEMARIARRMFDRDRSEETLIILLDAIGEDEREGVVDGALETILREQKLSTSDVEFLISVGRVDAAAGYVIDRSEQINGERYSTWAPVARDFEQKGNWLASTLAYRALLDSILDRGYSKAYHHGVDYLNSLETMSDQIQDWHGFAQHRPYVENLRRMHGRKWSFWQKVESG